MKHKAHTAQFRAGNSTTIANRRAKVYLASTEHAPTNVRISQRQAKGYTSGVSLRDVRHLMQPAPHTSTKQFATNGIGVREIIAAAPWSKGRYE